MTTKTAWIKSQLLANETPSDAASRLNTQTTVPNPAPQSQVSKPIDLVMLAGAIPAIERFKVLSNPIWDRITTALQTGDIQTVGSHMEALLAGSLISPATVAIVTPLLQQTELDPSWQATILASPAQLTGFDLVLVGDVQIAILSA